MNACIETEATVASYRSDILHGDNVELPRVYYPTVGWKMFVPPLERHPSKNNFIQLFNTTIIIVIIY